MLKRRGLFIKHGRRGVAIVPTDGAQIQNLYQVCEALDDLAECLAAMRVEANSTDNAGIENLKAAFEAGTVLDDKAAISDLIKTDVADHCALHGLYGNPEIARTIEEHWQQGSTPARA